MKHSLYYVFAVTTLLALSACEAEKVNVLKTPCAGAEGNPCGPKRVPTGNVVKAALLRQA